MSGVANNGESWRVSALSRNGRSDARKMTWKKERGRVRGTKKKEGSRGPQRIKRESKSASARDCENPESIVLVDVKSLMPTKRGGDRGRTLSSSDKP